ncbi:hypothetical protein [Streptosporangium sp. LJ11]|uniref:hypothetical protein n=1 Tax=Streptosporangium sp. LJ11 TaxID=3436927 RepID=UPI003F796E7A
MTRTEVHGPPHAISPPARLTERLAALVMPCPVHPSIHLVEAAAADWARAAGLDPDPAASRLAGRAFARCETGAVTPLARWLTWMSRLRQAPEALTPVLAVAAGGEPGPAPLERAFSGLWAACAPRMSGAWRERFTAGLAAQREAILPREPAAALSPGTPAKPRSSGAPAEPCSSGTPAEPGGDAFGRYLFDLVEPCLGVEVPAPVWRSPQWRALVEASGNVAARCEEAVAGRGHAGTVFLERSNREAEEWIIDSVATRMEELWTAARAIPALTERHDLGFAASREVTRVACAFLTIPRAYLEWLLETPRYRHLG